MSWALSIGTIRGTAVRLHWSFLLFLAGFGFAALLGGGAGAAFGVLSFLVLLFFCVVLHEFGHIFSARHFGIKTPDVVLFPIGGMSRLERIPDDPRQEFLIALAGPAVSLALAALLFLLLGGFPDPATLAAFGGPEANLLARLAYVNLILGLFNLLPAFPMDGGRVLRAILANWLGHGKGTRIAAGVGQVFALFFGIAGLSSGNFILVLIAVFIFVAARSEARSEEIRQATSGLLVEQVMITKFTSLSGDAPISDAAEALIRTEHPHFPVLGRNGIMLGLLTRQEIANALAMHEPATPVRKAVLIQIPLVPLHSLAEQAAKLFEGGVPAVGVVDAQNQIAGLITLENLLEHLMISRAMGKKEREPPRAGVQ